MAACAQKAIVVETDRPQSRLHGDPRRLVQAHVWGNEDFGLVV